MPSEQRPVLQVQIKSEWLESHNSREAEAAIKEEVADPVVEAEEEDPHGRGTNPPLHSQEFISLSQ